MEVLNLVFFGSDNFAVPSLKALIVNGYKICCVVTQPDRRKGRGLHWVGTPVREAASKAGLKFYQPANINTDETIKFLKSLKPGLCIVVAYGRILSSEILAIPQFFYLNLHASLLPRYRGAAPINWAIINGEETSGVTIIKMARKMDAGPIIAHSSVDINGDDNAISVEEKLSKTGAELLINTLKDIEKNKYGLMPQDEKKATFARKLKKEDGLINWEKPALEIHNLVRGCVPWPSTFTYYKGKLLKIYKTEIEEALTPPLRAGAGLRCQGAKVPGEILKLSGEGITVGTAEGNLIIKELQIEGKRVMRAEEFIAGHRIYVGELLGDKK